MTTPSEAVELAIAASRGGDLTALHALVDWPLSGAAGMGSELGRSVRADEPGRFRRFRLEAVRDAYRDVLAKGAV